MDFSDRDEIELIVHLEIKHVIKTRKPLIIKGIFSMMNNFNVIIYKECSTYLSSLIGFPGSRLNIRLLHELRSLTVVLSMP